MAKNSMEKSEIEQIQYVITVEDSLNTLLGTNAVEVLEIRPILLAKWNGLILMLS